jgi:hypothetical protein
MAGERMDQHGRRLQARLPRLLTGLITIVALLALTVVEAPDASLRILWRFAVLSFDHPSTQVLDEVACESSAPGEVGTEAREVTRPVLSGRFTPASEPARPPSSVLFSGITRSPPAA